MKLKTLPIRVLSRVMMLTAFALLIAAIVRVDFGYLTLSQGALRAAVWGAITVLGAVVSDAVEL